MIELIGWLGSIALGLCAIPAAWKVYQEKHAYYLSDLSIWLWWLGEVLTLAYLLIRAGESSWPLIANYTVNLFFVSVILYYKLWPTNTGWPILKGGK